MKCRYCKAEIPEGELYCKKCGREVQIVPDYNPLEEMLTAQIQLDGNEQESEFDQYINQKRRNNNRTGQSAGRNTGSTGRGAGRNTGRKQTKMGINDNRRTYGILYKSGERQKVSYETCCKRQRSFQKRHI